MTGRATVSLIIVSRHRPDCLHRCLTAVSLLDHPALEVLVVADPASLEIAGRFPVRTVAFDEPNISAARNAGIVAAAGEVVAFLDDDAVPEPLWLDHLTAPFENPQVGAAGGFVLGWNGLSYEWAGGTVDRLLRTAPLDCPDTAISLHPASAGKAIEVKGVNCAYRRQTIAALGGFDPALAYYLDETELNLRLASEGALVAMVPQARVQHRKADGPRRRADRTVTSLFDVGASSAVTLRRHGATDDEIAVARTEMLAREEERAAAYRRAGRLSAAEAEGLLATAAAGFADGLTRALSPLQPLPAADPGAFRPVPQRDRPQVILSGRPWQARQLRRAARQQAADGAVVQLYLFSPTTLYHQRRFSDGYWQQTGGLFGKSSRTDRFFRFWRFASRLLREESRFRSGFRKT
ncbi:glycosyltransferase [Frigidibacter sp. RF13]|uniref:glycosyltransferase family 2 protein n=1 Tax=Frigidibacter sp. RF13 TaxID=2997340 RepID=UPI00226E7BDE|nr:glycosyltransferase [Frigidibacter sp. RF13]MCY1128398.1 glycosyltransferase [Frigidibacter sp. RF13]